MKKLISVILILALVLCAMPVIASADDSKPFVDVPNNSWYTAGVLYCYEHELMVGTGEGKFSPQSPVTRAMVCTVLWRQAGAPEPVGDSYFLDVPNGKWYTKAVNWMYETRIVNGIGRQLFEPNTPITRQDMATILYGYSDMMRYNINNRATIYIQDLGNGQTEGVYKDGLKVSRYAVIGMEWCVANGFIMGTAQDTLSPKTTMTRAQMATILYRFCTWLEKPQPKIWWRTDLGDSDMPYTVYYPTETSAGYIKYVDNWSHKVYCHYLEKGLTEHYPTKKELQSMCNKLNAWLALEPGWTVTEDHPTDSYSVDVSFSYMFYTADMYENARGWLKALVQLDQQNEENFGHVGVMQCESSDRWTIVMYYG